MIIVEHRRGNYWISTDKALLDVSLIHRYLSNSSYWAEGRPFAVVQMSIEHSLCFGVYAKRQQMGFARVVTDYTTFAWLIDVFILESHRGRGLGKWLVKCIVAHPEIKTLGICLLATRDAHDLYPTTTALRSSRHRKDGCVGAKNSQGLLRGMDRA